MLISMNRCHSSLFPYIWEFQFGLEKNGENEREIFSSKLLNTGLLFCEKFYVSPPKEFGKNGKERECLPVSLDLASYFLTYFCYHFSSYYKVQP